MFNLKTQWGTEILLMFLLNVTLEKEKLWKIKIDLSCHLGGFFGTSFPDLFKARPLFHQQESTT